MARAARLLLSMIAALLTALVLLVGLVSDAVAQDENPMRMAVINASERGGEQPRTQIVDILYGNEAIELIESEDIRRDMEDFGVNEKVLRKQELREKFRSRLMRMVQAKRIEGLLIIDVYNKGRTLQVVVIGPEGEELQDVRRSIKRGQLESDTAIDVLQEIFPVLGPEVLAFRERQALTSAQNDPAKTPTETDPDTADPDNGAQVTDSDVADGNAEDKKDGYFARGIDIGAGYYFGDRVFFLEEVDNNSPDFLDHKTPMSGVGIQLDATALTFGKQQSSSLALRGSFAIGFFRTTSKVVNSAGNESVAKYQSESFDLKGELLFRKMLGSRFHLGVFGGVQNLVINISQTSLPDEETGQTYNNSRYTGTGYLAARAGLEGGFRFTNSILASVNAGALPLLSANVSQALGESETSVGFFGGGRLKLNFTRNIFAQASYVFSFFRPIFPEPPGMAAGGTINIDSRAEGTDYVHNFQAVLGLSF